MKLFQQLRLSYVSLALLCFCCSCEEIYHIDSQGISDIIAFDGVITNEPPPYFFRLTHVAPLGSQFEMGVVDAQVIITDHTAGLIDTLKLIDPKVGQYGTILSYYNYYLKKNASYELPHIEEDNHGIYVTTKIYGIEKHQYTLDILYRGKHHTAHEAMAPKTPITDMTIKEVDLGVKGKKWAPCISFVNRPGEKNYYLFKIDRYSTKTFRVAEPHRFYGARSYWPFSVLNDEYLEEKVVDFLVSEGEQKIGAPGASYPGNSDSLFVWMQSISEGCYVGYEDMIKQLRNDGGAYTPRPVGVRGNISGGVLGLFRVSAISERYVLTGKH